jgi:hypothetical protein
MTFQEKLAKIRELGGDVHFAEHDYWCDCGEVYDNHILTSLIERGNSPEEAVENCWKVIEALSPKQFVYAIGRYVLLYKGEWIDLDIQAMRKRNIK